jgi:hypothetical protein
MVVGVRISAAMAVLVASFAAGSLLQVASPAVSHADPVVCPAGMYWDVYTDQCLYYNAVDVYLNPTPIVGPNPVVGPVGPVGVGGVVGPVGVGPVGPGPVGPGPVGPGRR